MAKRKNKQLRALEESAMQHGFVLVRSNKHLVYRHPALKEQLVVAHSASDRRAHQNNVSRLKRLVRQLPEQYLEAA
jgi:hypothetical protein